MTRAARRAGILASALAAGCAASSPTHEEMEMKPQDAVHVVDSTMSLEHVQEDLAAACQEHGFGVLATHDLQAKMKSKGVEFPEPCRVVEICDPHQASRVLREDLRISTALPCRISIFRHGTGTRLATIRPSTMLQLRSVVMPTIARHCRILSRPRPLRSVRTHSRHSSASFSWIATC